MQPFVLSFVITHLILIISTIKPYTPARALCSASAKWLAAPALRGGPKFPLAQTRRFAFLAPKWWNELPIDIRTAETHLPAQTENSSLSTPLRAITLLTKHLYTNTGLAYLKPVE